MSSILIQLVELLFYYNLCPMKQVEDTSTLYKKIKINLKYFKSHEHTNLLVDKAIDYSSKTMILSYLSHLFLLVNVLFDYRLHLIPSAVPFVLILLVMIPNDYLRLEVLQVAENIFHVAILIVDCFYLI